MSSEHANCCYDITVICYVLLHLYSDLLCVRSLLQTGTVIQCVLNSAWYESVAVQLLLVNCVLTLETFGVTVLLS